MMWIQITLKAISLFPREDKITTTKKTVEISTLLYGLSALEKIPLKKQQKNIKLFWFINNLYSK